MKRCSQGHYYDATKYSRCPACGIPDLAVQATQGHAVAVAETPINLDKIDKTQAFGSPARAGAGEGRTVGLMRKRTGIDPVVGWLVCINGPERGRDYRIHSERNFIGRDASMDICISGDDTISRHKHAIISHNPESNRFKILPGDSRGIVYCNGDEVDSPCELHNRDIIKLGQTELLFASLCDDTFRWK